MEVIDDYIDGLILDYLSEDISVTDRVSLEAWVSASVEHERLFKKRVQEFQMIRSSVFWHKVAEEKAREKVLNRLNRRRRIFRLSSYAAAMVVVMTTAVWFYSYFPGNVDEVVKVSTAQLQVCPVLTLNDGQEIPLTAGILGTVCQSGRVHVAMVDSNGLKYAAVGMDSVPVVRYHTLTIPRGCEFNLTLSDGTKVWLNAGSVLKYPERFSTGQRDVQLSGEGYFEVMPDATAPFRVETRGMKLTVLGTCFNISAYPDDSQVVTSLITGKVSQVYEGVEQTLVLTPLEQSVYNRMSHEVVVEKVDVTEVLAWKDGKIVVRDGRLEDIFQQLKRWYDFEVVYVRSELKDERFYLNTDRYEHVETVLEKLEKTNGITFSVKDGMIYVK